MCLTRYSLGHQYFMWYELHPESGAWLLCRGYVRWASHERREYSMSATTAAASAQRESCSGRCPSQATGCVGSGNSRTLATSCEQLTHWKRLWCLEELGAGGEGVNRGWDGWMESPAPWTWVWVNSGGWWWIGRPGVLRFMGLQRVGNDWATELNWTE